ncbi:cation diffusion facilitator family transporter [Methanocella arvoryzae]|uniref:Predicted cation efflux protein n=1 Tax=Methanocella arvoryzae (strain DSM 22066 / NBRC 105507 / MRE50) TaxID=351160 RepID=Q0W2J0_METAR|nr:cation diffusion facilitator family transporter [Methanocella arvoryzae]CAJ37403.1 predicted cation efflux protein [Methanocella arvoryzae MRE50]
MSSSIEELNREKTSIARLSIVSNLSLVILKLIVGVMIGSVSVISEAIHSGIDLVAAVIAYFSVRTSSKPPDHEHAFGHGKLENISGTIEALLIFVAAGFIIYEAYEKILHGVVLEDVSLGIAVMLLSAIVNLYVSQRLMKTAKRTESIALEADAWHLRTDVLTSLGIFAGLVAIKLTGITILDPIFAILVAVFILKAAVELIVRSVKDLMDVKLPEEEENEICQIIEDHSQQYAGFHKLRTRKSGSDRFIDLHLVVSKELTIEQAHCLATHIEKDIKDRFPRASIIIHTEPCKDGDECKKCRVRECSKYQFREEE